MTDKVVTCLFFDGTAEEAVALYTSLLPDSRVVGTTLYGPGAPRPEGTVMTIQFDLQGRRFMAINGGPDFAFTPAISLVAYCATQAELDRLWDALCDGGAPMACGWVTDRYGVSWQVVPSVLPELMHGAPERANRVMQALWGMIKLDTEALLHAADAT